MLCMVDATSSRLAWQRRSTANSCCDTRWARSIQALGTGIGKREKFTTVAWRGCQLGTTYRP